MTLVLAFYIRIECTEQFKKASLFKSLSTWRLSDGCVQASSGELSKSQAAQGPL